MNCERHAEREGTLTVDLPSLNCRRYMCAECKAAFVASLTPFQGKREAWDRNDYDVVSSGGEIRYRTPSGWRSENPNDRSIWK